MKTAPVLPAPNLSMSQHSTCVSKDQVLDDHVIPFFGQMPLDAIGPAEIEDFKAAMRAKKSAARARKEAPTQTAIRKRKALEPKTLSLKTINNALTVLRKLLSVAEEQRVLAQAPRVKLFTKLPKPTFDFLTFEEAERLIDAADPQWRALILAGLKSGLRQGELIGLQWSDVDLQRVKLNINRTIWRGVAGLPKHLSPDTRRETVNVLDRPLAPGCRFDLFVVPWIRFFWKRNQSLG